ncbi:MAG TPA: nucleotide exchange factor GrpE [bacterium]|nr:nucleotide exchange factor GrpE [bacterium]HNS34069.1 nucleotide exchange factor GrpE [bacterium]HNW09041.1 nucleotide exchange factor GrpE [bacterium]HPN81072.1 nucleotide exchange factor GrpE [bacterium]HPW39182.1 nucleotide exchange factor GrpE [bacterium]
MTKNHSDRSDRLKEQLEQVRAEAEKNLAGWQRAQADYANLKRDSEKRGAELFALANAAFMAEILPVYNHFKLALKHLPKEQADQDWVIGIKQIAKQFQEFLKKYQVEEVATVGKKFDPAIHEAVVHETKDGFESDVIFEEVQPGYLVDGKLLNPAKVKVAK